MFLLHRFLQRLHLRERLRREVFFRQRNNSYTIPEMPLALLYPIILGLERIETTELLQRNGVFQTLTGLPAYPDPTALRRFLQRFAVRGLPKLRRLHDRLLAEMCQRPRPLRRALFDLDSTVLTLYGHEEKYFLVNWMKRLCLPTTYHTMMLSTLRPRLFMLPAEFVRLSEGQTLRFPSALPERPAIEHALKRIDQLRI